MTDLLTQFELLLEAGKLDEAKQMLRSLAAREPTAEERGAAKALLARLYVKLSNAINQAYLETLKDAIVSLKELDAKEKAFLEKVKLAETRSSLHGTEAEPSGN